METDTIQRLLDLNHLFYQTFAGDFSATRQRLQPGVRKILTGFSPEADLLDLGCGNGELWRTLRQGGHRGRYVGLDFSPELLAAARGRGMEFAATGEAFFLQADLSTPEWERAVQALTASWQQFDGFDVVLSFAVLHHIPGVEIRKAILERVHDLLIPGGRFIHSEWQFLNSPRLRERIHEWQEVGMEAEQMDPGDYLLDWRRGGQGLRYVHHFSPDELTWLAESCGFRILETFPSDGEGGNLGLYQVWEQV